MAIQTIPGAAAGDLTTLLGTSGADVIETKTTETKDIFIDALAGGDDITVVAGVEDVRVEGDEGSDSITFEGFVFGTDKRISGGQDDDTITFEKDVEDATVRGGKDDDLITFEADLEDSSIYGDEGTDTLNFDGVVLKTGIYGGDDNDTIKISSRVDTSTVWGGEGDDSIVQDDAGTLDNYKALGQVGDDIIKFGNGKIQAATANGGAGNDTIELLSTATLTTGSVNIYGGKNDDSVKLSAGIKNVTVSGDKGNDTITIASTTTATIYGGDGDDKTINSGNGSTFQNGNAGDDTLDGGTASDTIYGGQGDDLIEGGATAADKLYGNKGDDTITSQGGDDLVNGNEGEDLLTGGDGDQSIYGGEGDDTINAITVAADNATLVVAGLGDDKITAGLDTAGNKLTYTINGGAGEDTLTLNDSGANGTYLIEYDSFADFYASGNTVDVITMDNDDTATNTIEVAGALKFDSADEFDNVTTTAGLFTLATAKSVTTGSSVVFDDAVGNHFNAVDLSAGTTGSSKIDVSDETDVAYTLKGGAGRNTLTGGGGADTITGGATLDTITGSAGKDLLDGAEGVTNFVQAVGDSGAALASTVADPAVFDAADLAAVDILVVSTGDVITYGGAALTFTAVNSGTAAVDASGGAVTLGDSADISVQTGVYNGTTFTTAAKAASDAVVVTFDNNGATGGTTYETILLSGVNALTTVALDGTITV